MHQIRLHLQYLGHPIVNDPLYNTLAFGPMKGRGADYGGFSREELVENLRKEHCVSDWVIEPGELLRESENVLRLRESSQGLRESPHQRSTRKMSTCSLVTWTSSLVPHSIPPNKSPMERVRSASSSTHHLHLDLS